MHINHQLKVVHTHFGKALIPQNTGIVNQNIHPAPFLNGLGNHGFNFIHLGHIGTIGNGFTASGFNHGNGFHGSIA